MAEHRTLHEALAALADLVEKKTAQVIYTHSTWHGPALYDGAWTCSCGDRIDDRKTGINIVARHQQHLARAVLDAVADDLRAKGFYDGVRQQYAAREHVQFNPYREEADHG